MGNIGIGELLVILLILLLIFGAKRLPEIGRSLGRTMHEFKKGMREGEEKENRHDGRIIRHARGAGEKKRGRQTIRQPLGRR